MSFTSLRKAELYEKYRLPYPSELVDDLLRYTGDVQVVADIGAGTGQLARMFACACQQVYAIEPDPAMRQAAAVALADYRNVSILAALAEALPFPDRSIDLIVIGNAFHRFRPGACAELPRALKPQGWAALVSYQFLDVGFTSLLCVKLAELRGLAGRIERAWHAPSTDELFGQAQPRTLCFRQVCREDWTAFFGAACAGIEAPEPGDAEYPQFEQLNRQVFEAFSEAGEITIEYETRLTFGQPLTYPPS
jgi:SAM-dependent methyltransferase